MISSHNTKKKRELRSLKKKIKEVTSQSLGDLQKKEKLLLQKKENTHI